MMPCQEEVESRERDWVDAARVVEIEDGAGCTVRAVHMV